MDQMVELKQMLLLSTGIYKFDGEVKDHYTDELLETIRKLNPRAEVLTFIDTGASSSDLQAAIAVNHQARRISVIFRGSSSWVDWYFDFQAASTSFIGGARVHRGFHRLLYDDNRVFDKLRSYIEKELQQYPHYQILVTGHSLGGALATLFGFLISGYVGTFTQVDVISFASPRVGDATWVKLFQAQRNLRHTRVVHRADLVPYLPMWYSHADTYEGEKVIGLRMTWPWKAHRCDSYLEALETEIASKERQLTNQTELSATILH